MRLRATPGGAAAQSAAGQGVAAACPKCHAHLRAQAEAQAAPGGAPSSAALSGEEAQRVMGAAVAQADAAAARVGREEGGGRASGVLEGAGGGGVQERLAALRAAALG